MWVGTVAERRGLLAIALSLLTVAGMLVLAKPAGAATSTVPDGKAGARSWYLTIKG